MSFRYLPIKLLETRICARVYLLSRVQLFATLRTVAHQAPLSMRFFKLEYWSGLLFPTPQDLPYSGIEPATLASPALAGGFFYHCATWEALDRHTYPLQIKMPELTKAQKLAHSSAVYKRHSSTALERNKHRTPEALKVFPSHSCASNPS